ncbi:MAG: glycosyltransferase family 2 protein, partial [Gammaproteobacteria bacterium]
FYDVALRADNRHLLCIGPATEPLAPIEFWIDGRRASFLHRRQYGCIALYQSQLQVAAGSEVKIRMADYSWQFELAANSLSHTARSLSLVTQQKDNPIAWVQDWVQYHHKTQGVQRLILYDNASTNRQELATWLQQLHSLEVVLVQWDFPYGAYISDAAGRSLQFIEQRQTGSQFGSLNHCNQVFCQGDWLLNLDIDEYLGGSVPLRHFLMGCRLINCDRYLFQKRIFANVVPEEQPADKLLTFRDYRYQNPDHIYKGRGKKYVARSHPGRCFYIHDCRPASLEAIQRQHPSPVWKAFLTRWRTFLNRLQFGRLVWSKAVLSWGVIRIPVPVIRSLSRFFYEYHGLCTNWKPGTEVRTHRVVLSDTPKGMRYVEDTSIIRNAEREGI